MARRFPVLRARYSGLPRLVEKELTVNYGRPWRPDKDSPWRTEKTIFIENMGDLFAEGIKDNWINRILAHCQLYPDNVYVLQTKNPERVNNFIEKINSTWRKKSIFLVGTTAETDIEQPRIYPSSPPNAWDRVKSMFELQIPSEKKFATVEPIQHFHKKIFLKMLLLADVGTIYIGADSKGHGLPEPTGPEIKALVEGLREVGKTVILKSNLKRLYKEDLDNV